MKKILIIEDNKDVRENTAEILELANYEVVTAENGKLGVEMAKSTHPDLIIWDRHPVNGATNLAPKIVQRARLRVFIMIELQMGLVSIRHINWFVSGRTWVTLFAHDVKNTARFEP